MVLDLKTALGLMDNAFIDETFEELVLPEGMTVIPGCMCENCRELKKVILPSTIKVISNAAFCNCKKLSEINLPEGLEVIWDDAFSGCQSLREIALPSGIKRIKPEAFESTVIESSPYLNSSIIVFLCLQSIEVACDSPIRKTHRLWNCFSS